MSNTQSWQCWGWISACNFKTVGRTEELLHLAAKPLHAAKFLMKMQLSDLGNRWFGENFIIPWLTATWVEHDIHNCCQNQLVAARYQERMRSSNWNSLLREEDRGIRSDQISSILLAVCKQLLINNTVTVWRQMTPRFQKHTHSLSLGVGKLPGVSAHTSNFTLSNTKSQHSTLTFPSPFIKRFESILFELSGRYFFPFSSFYKSLF